jgi:hypothetical protein
MKLTSFAKLRITVLLAIAIAETVSLFICYGQRSFYPFLVFSLLAIFLITPLLWIDWIRQHEVPYLDIFTTVTASFCAFTSWVKGAHIFALLFTAWFILGAISIPRRLFRAVSKTQGGRA